MFEPRKYGEQAPFAYTIDEIALVPREGIVPSRSKIKLNPFIYSAPMDMVTGGLLAHEMMQQGHYAVGTRYSKNPDEFSNILEYTAGDPQRFFISIGLIDTSELTELLHKLTETVEPKTIGVAIDIAHGDMKDAHKLYYALATSDFFHSIMSGSICTPAAARRCIFNGVTHLRVGVGCGSACLTRIQTGVGIPNAYAVESIHEDLSIIKKRKLATIVADGGIRDSGDACKYLALGADGVMLGSALAKTKESLGWVKRAGKFVKAYRGQASAQFQEEVLGIPTSWCPEGVTLPEQVWDGRTHVRDVIKYYEEGLRSGLSYLGYSSLEEMHHRRPDYVFVSEAGRREAQPHGLTLDYKQ